MFGGALDMTLDDVIKQKAKSGKSGNERNQANGRNSDAKTPSATTEAAVAGSGASGGPKRLRRFTASKNALAPAAKAAAAAAKATSMKDGRFVTRMREGGQAAKLAASSARAARAPAPKPAAEVDSVEHAEQKLGMSLDEVIKSDVTRKRPNKPALLATAAAAKGQQDGDGSLKSSGRRRKIMKLRKGVAAKPKAKAKAKGKAKAKAQAKTQSRTDDSWGRSGRGGSNNAKSGGGWNDNWNGGGGGGGGRRSSWEEKQPPRSGMYSDWGTAGSKRRAEGGYEPPQKRQRTMGEVRNNSGWGNNGNSGNSGGWGSAPQWPRERWNDHDTERWSGGGGGGGCRGGGDGGSATGGSGWTRSRGYNNDAAEASSFARRPMKTSNENESAKASSRTGGGSGGSGGTTGNQSRIKVANIPKDLDWRDIKEAFEDTGKVMRCDLEKGVAWVTFDTVLDAKEAVKTFDRGELNGQTIFVTRE